jgi:nitrite reductase/ring-hydroxylating ferredoxin subunit
VPEGFVPPPGWQPDPSWPTPPPGWQLWVQDEMDASGRLPVAPPVTPRDYRYTDGAKAGTNGFAIASFVLGLLGGVLLSVIFGVVALNKLRYRRQRGKGLAIAGLCLSGVWVAGIAAVLVVNSLTASHRSTTTGQITKKGHLDVFSLRTGDCFQNPSGSQSNPGLTQVTAVPCTSSHDAQVIAQLPVQGSTYPGRVTFREQAMRGCKASIRADVDRSKLTSTMKLLWLYPLPEAWAHGERTISCLVVDSSQDLTSSLLK